jgi:hypothetical protein
MLKTNDIHKKIIKSVKELLDLSEKIADLSRFPNEDHLIDEVLKSVELVQTSYQDVFHLLEVSIKSIDEAEEEIDISELEEDENGIPLN